MPKTILTASRQGRGQKKFSGGGKSRAEGARKKFSIFWRNYRKIFDFFEEIIEKFSIFLDKIINYFAPVAPIETNIFLQVLEQIRIQYDIDYNWLLF